ncbi:MAG: TolC family protein [Saprospiraceae bacterium]|nr:TolC family protein [Saprospiraceae bacterium]MDW8230352.1 TolC family protein [Saprospiraceae bacterium]
MKLPIRLAWFFLLPLLWSPIVYAQRSTVLEQYIQAGLTHNLALQQQDWQLRKAQESVRQAKALSYPVFQFEANYMRATGGRRIQFPVGDLVNPIFANLNLLNELVQPGSPDYPTDVPNVNEQFLPDDFHETKVRFSYPLFNTDLKYNRLIRQELYASQAAQKAAYEVELRYRIAAAYLNYLQAIEAEKIWLNSRTVLQELRRFNESLVNHHVATRDAVAAADYELSKAESELVRLRGAQNTARAYFNYLLHRDLQSEVVADTALMQPAAATYALEPLLAQALAQRPELAALQAGIRAADADTRRNAANLRVPDFYVGGELGFQGFGYRFDSEQAYALVRVGMTYDLFDGGLRRSRAQEARLEAERLRTQLADAEQQIALQITEARNAWQAAQQAYTAAQMGVRAAEEAFRIVNNKYRANQTLLIEWLNAQNRLSTAQLQQSLAWYDVLLKEAALRRAAGF